MAQITDAQRYTISVMLRKNYQRKDICEAIGVSKSVLSREISRNKNPNTGTYSHTYAKMAVSVRKERYKNPRIFTKEVKAMVEGHLREDWSPEQIAGYCKAHGIKAPSIERIYQHIRQDKKNGGDLYKHCRHQLKHRARQVGKHMPIKDRVSIDDRPAEADGTRFGDYEMDLIVGPGNKDAMLTLAERSTCMCFISNLPNGKNSKGVSQAAIRKIFAFRNTIKSITTDNGPEFAEHKEIAKKLKTTVYFAHPYHSWEKGLIENTNKLIRQYIPKDANFKDFTDEEIKRIQYKLNSRPRKKLGYRTPLEVFYEMLQKSCI